MSQIPTGVVVTLIGVIVLLSANLFDNTTAQAILSLVGAVITVIGAVMAWRYRHENKTSTD